ncbi:MAG: PilW family protein, partial [Steroidobacteraceae bacterium]
MRHRQHGLSLVELLIAMGLSLGVIYAAVSLFMANRGTAATTQGIAALSDSGRVGLTFIGGSVRSGGYMACNGTNSTKGVIYTNGTTRQ